MLGDSASMRRFERFARTLATFPASKRDNPAGPQPLSGYSMTTEGRKSPFYRGCTEVGIFAGEGRLTHTQNGPHEGSVLECRHTGCP